MTTDATQEYDIPGICKRCFGRAFAKIGTGISNTERGENYFPEKKAIFSEAGFQLLDEASCSICHGVFLRFNDYYQELKSELNGIEFSNFLVGSKFPRESVETEEKLQGALVGDGEPVKREFNREFGKYISEQTGKEAEFDDPELTIVVDLNYDSFKLKTKSLYVYGIYRKHRRDIPQTRWIHKKDIEDSIETIMGEKLTAMTQGKNYFLHGAGREDVDVRMLGNGREFIIESSEPKVRSIPLDKLARDINSSGEGVEVEDLRIAGRGEVIELKSKTPDKSYRVRVRSSSDIDRNRMNEAAGKLTGKHIYQRTPLRVSTRRSDLIREKQIKEVSVEEILGDIAVIKVRAEAGTYIKELIHGDDGRTRPSLSESYGEPLTVDTLDVIWIHRNGD